MSRSLKRERQTGNTGADYKKITPDFHIDFSQERKTKIQIDFRLSHGL
jgi:hypothetical protein